jgi:hypothetical protein
MVFLADPGNPSRVQYLFIPGEDLGANPFGYTNNFAWGCVDITGSSLLKLYDGNTDTGGALYTGILKGAVIDGLTISNIQGNGLKIYYRADALENAYLNSLSYDLIGGGLLVPIIPEPMSLILLAAGVLGTFYRRNR